MAEIEFKRRGTPVWAVVLALLVIAAAIWVVFGRADTPATPATASPSAHWSPTGTPSAIANRGAAAATTSG